MEITLQKKDSTNATIKINLSEADYKNQYNEKLKEYSKKSQIKGFRPGKVPPGLIQRMYGKGILVDEINNMLSKSITDYIKENKLPVIGDPIPETESVSKIDWDNQKDFEFIYDVGLVPEFSFDLAKTEVTKYDIQPDEKVVNETLENLRNQYGKMSSPEETAEGDFLSGQIKEANAELTTASSLPLNKVEKSELAKFTNKKIGDTITFEVEKAFKDASEIAYVTGLSQEEAEKKTGAFQFTISKISRPEPANLDQDFFDKIFGKDTVKTEEEFKAKLKDTITENYTRESEQLLDKELQEKLVETTAIDLPNDFLKKWLLVSNQGKITQEQIDNEYDLYLKELKWTLIKNKIAEQADVKVENEEITAFTKKMILQQFGGMNISEDMEEGLNKITDNYLKQDKGKNYMKVFEQVLAEKVFEYLRGQAAVKDKKVTVDEFKSIARF